MFHLTVLSPESARPMFDFASYGEEPIGSPFLLVLTDDYYSPFHHTEKQPVEGQRSPAKEALSHSSDKYATEFSTNI